MGGGFERRCVGRVCVADGRMYPKNFELRKHQ